MSTLNTHRVTFPLICLALALFALGVSVVSLFYSVSVATVNASEFQAIWPTLQNATIKGSEVAAADRMMNSVLAMGTQLQYGVKLSLGLAVLSFIIFGWLVLAGQKARPERQAHLVERANDTPNSELAAVMKLADEISPIGKGDLRVSATASDHATGKLAEPFNHAISELRWLVSLLDSSSTQLGDSLERSRQRSDKVSYACAEQSRQIHRSSNYLFSMSATMSGLSADAAESTLSAQTAVAKAEAGGVALRASLNTLSAIRDEADNTTRLMHRLADNAEAIDERVVRVQEVAKQTDLLALNTTIRASAGSRHATANDAAADLGRLSDEVAQLAEVLGQATRDIGSITRIISEDASETVQSMEHIAAELVSGVQQTQHANDALFVIQDNSKSLHERVLQMTERCVEQTGIVRQLTENMDQLNQITDQASEGVSLNVAALDDLQELSVELRERVSDYRLPSTQSAQTSTSVARRAANRAVKA